MTDSTSSAAAYAVIGQPIEHSLSPLIHRHFAAITGHELSYDLLDVAADGFVSAARSFFAEGGSGLNVTLPFKEQAHDLMQRLSPAATVAGAVNTIRPTDGILEGHNTDGVGLIQDLEQNLGWPLNGARILLIGAGGASRGALAALLARVPESLVVTNRTLDRAHALVADVAPGEPRLHVSAAAELADPFDVVINATSASLAGQGALVPTDVVRDARCYDMLYASTQTVFAGWALSHGAREVCDGLGMLLEQAAEAFALWRGVRPDTSKLLASRDALFAAKKSAALSLDEFLAEQNAQHPADADRSLLKQTNAASSRFIAGAVCPDCREIDRIVVRDGVEGREQVCVACGFSQPAVQKGEAGLVPRGKPERNPVADSDSIASQPVRFIDPDLSTSKSSSRSPVTPAKTSAKTPRKKTD